MTAPLLTVLRAARHGGTPSGELDRAALAEQAARHGLAGVIRRLAGGGLASAALDRAALLEAAHAAAVRAFLEETLDAAREAGVIPVLLKGYGFAARYYPEPLLRFGRDVDLLVRPAERPALEDAMRQRGLSRARAHHGAIELSGPRGTLDLHLSPVEAFGVRWPAAPLLDRARDATLLGRPVRYLAREDELLYLSLHAANHLNQRLAWLHDLALLAADPALDWSVFLSRVPDRTAGAVAWLALDAAWRLLEAPVPEAVRERLAPAPLRQRIARGLLGEEAILEQRLWGRRMKWALVKVALAPGPSALVRWTVRELLERVAGWHRRG